MNTTGTNSTRLKKINRKSILEALLGTDALSVADLSRLTNLSIATCANALNDMVEDGEAMELEERKSQGGRPARYYAFNPDHFQMAILLLMVENGVQTIAYSVTNAFGAIVESGLAETSDAALPDIEKLLTFLTTRHARLRSVAISVPGVVRDGVIDFCDIPSLEGVRLEERLRAMFPLVPVVDNDTNFAAMGYYRASADTGTMGLVYMFFPPDRNMGAGIVIDGRLVRGKTSFAGELSFIPFNRSPFKQQVRAHPAPDTFIRYAGMVAAAVTAMVNPDVIVLSGGAVAEDMCTAIRGVCLESIPVKHMPELVVRTENDGDTRAGMVGMALDAYLRFHMTEKEKSHDFYS